MPVTHIRDESELVITGEREGSIDPPQVISYCLRFIPVASPWVTVHASWGRLASLPRLCRPCERFRDNRRKAGKTLAIIALRRPGAPCPSCRVDHAPAV